MEAPLYLNPEVHTIYMSCLSISSVFPADGDGIKTRTGVQARGSKIQRFSVSKSALCIRETQGEYDHTVENQ